MADSVVKVGVRIRPLLQKEKGSQTSANSTCFDNYDQKRIEFRNNTFTFDHVFGPDLTQQELYQNTAAPMLKSFLEGYNVTIMA